MQSAKTELDTVNAQLKEKDAKLLATEVQVTALTKVLLASACFSAVFLAFFLRNTLRVDMLPRRLPR